MKLYNINAVQSTEPYIRYVDDIETTIHVVDNIRC